MSKKNFSPGQELPNIAEQVHLWRIAFAMTQADLELKAGLSHNSISRIECSSVSPRLSTLERLAGALGISVEQLQFQKPEICVREDKGDFGDNNINDLCSMLSKIPEPKRSKLINIFQKLIQTVLWEDHA